MNERNYRRAAALLVIASIVLAVTAFGLDRSSSKTADALPSPAAATAPPAAAAARPVAEPPPVVTPVQIRWPDDAKDDAPRREARRRDRGAWLGVSLQALDPALGEAFDFDGSGVLVTGVVDDSPAAAAGLRTGDIITEFDGRKIDAVAQLQRAVQEHGPGAVSIGIVRQGETRTVEAQLSARRQATIDARPAPGGERPRRYREHQAERKPWPGRAERPWKQAPPKPPRGELRPKAMDRQACAPPCMHHRGCGGSCQYPRAWGPQCMHHQGCGASCKDAQACGPQCMHHQGCGASCKHAQACGPQCMHHQGCGAPCQHPQACGPQRMHHACGRDCRPDPARLHASMPFLQPTYLGVRLGAMDQDLARYFEIEAGDGVLVLSVLDDSPAERAGVRSGDVITHIDGARVDSPETLSQAVREREPGDRVTIRLIRQGRERELEVELERHQGPRIFESLGDMDLEDIRLPELGDEVAKGLGELRRRLEEGELDIDTGRIREWVGKLDELPEHLGKRLEGLEDELRTLEEKLRSIEDEIGEERSSQ